MRASHACLESSLEKGSWQSLAALCTVWQSENERLPCAGGLHIYWGMTTPTQMHTSTSHAQPMLRCLVLIGLTLLLYSCISVLCIWSLHKSLVRQQHTNENLPWPIGDIELAS